MEQQSVFIQTLGNYPQIRILDFLMYSRNFDYPITEIAKNANVNFQTLKKLWPQMEAKELVVKTRVLGGVSLFKMNIKNHIAKKLIEFDIDICWKEFEKETSHHRLPASPKNKAEIVAV